MRTKITKAFVYVFLTGLLCSTVYSQNVKPDLPVLGFGVREGGSRYARTSDIDQSDWWPDSRIWTVPSRVVNVDGTPSTNWNEVLVPVFIENTWYNMNKVDGLQFAELSSFTFRVYYDSNIISFMDVQRHHPYTAEEAENLRNTHFLNAGMGDSYVEPLAKNFNVSTSVEYVNDYYGYFNNYDKRNGARVTVSGIASSFHKLDTTGYGEKKILCYLRFRVKLTQNTPTGNNHTSKLYFDPTYILYNGVNIAKDKGLKLLKDFPTNLPTTNYFTNIQTIVGTNDNMPYFDPNWDYPKKVEQVESHLVGLQRYSNISDPELYLADPYLSGSIDLRVMQDRPSFVLTAINPNALPNEQTQIALVSPNDQSTWRLTVPIMVDTLVGRPTSSYRIKAGREIDLDISGDPKCTMEDIIIETDQPWLKVRCNTPPSGYENKFLDNASYRRIFVQRINKLIDQSNNDYNPFPAAADQDAEKPKRFRFYIECNNVLEGGSLIPGEYFGYVTIKSAFDKYEPTRIQVRFIVNARPIEQAITAPTGKVTPFGIVLNITPFNGSRTDLTQTLIMGSDTLATTSVDSLYGEFPQPNVLGLDRLNRNVTFDARFFLDANVYPKPTSTDDIPMWQLLTSNGFGDMTHFDGEAQNSDAYNDNNKGRSNSRDIRTSLPTNESHIYYVKYKYANAASEDFYPVVLQWDANQFATTKNNTIFLRYMLDGQQYVRDMRTEGTPIGGGQYTYSFLDRNVQEFWIEYTVGEEQAEDLKDNFGDPMIVARSWNMVSLPLNPINKYYSYIFPNALNIPYLYTQNQWQEPTDGILQPGIGYFVKYQNITDKKFYGSYFDRINSSNFPVKLYSGDNGEGGWNVIGALSVPVSVDRMYFEQYMTEQADAEYTRTNGVWAYRPKGGYEEVSTLVPGKGYWIKVDKNAYYGITKAKSVSEIPTTLPNKTAGFDIINITDNSQNSKNLFAASKLDINRYQLPPVPPAGMFDIRFNGDNYASAYGEATIKLQGVTYPVVVTIDNPKANYTVIDPVSGQIYGKVKAGVSSNVVVSNSKSNMLKLVIEGSDESFFVTVNNNPVNTNTAELTFGLLNEGDVDIAIYNALGNEVFSLNAGVLNAGVYSRNVDVTNLPSGSYTVRLLVGTETRIFRMNMIK